MTSHPRVCVIGAGLAGLISARYLKDEGIQFVVFESTRYVGGTWRYDHRVGTDENGLPIHTSMYKNLRTNLPKSTMEFRGFPVPADMPSFPRGEVYYNYIKDFVRYFDLEKHIKFLHKVTLVSRNNNAWKVKYQNVLTSEEFEDEYDFVIVGNGHFNKPNMPNIRGEEKFAGSIIHSHDYRVPDGYIDRRVLVIGAGPSGMDIALDVAHVCRILLHSHHSRAKLGTPFPKNYIKKPDVKEFTETGVIFEDGSYEDIDDVIYCTGFQYYYPFLDDTCELSLTSRSVTPLYKHMVNINQPTMVFIAMVLQSCVVIAMDAQARYVAALIKGKFKLPSKEKMMEEWQKQAEAIKVKGGPPSDIHHLGDKEDEYYAELTAESGIERVPPVIMKIKDLDVEAMNENLYTFRNYAYTIVDDENFVRTIEDKTEHRENGI